MKKFFLIIILAFGFSGCGNMINPNIESVAPAFYTGGGFSGGSTNNTDTGFNCPSRFNVLPQSAGSESSLTNFGTNQGNSFTVCTSQAAGDYSNLLIHGQTHYSQTICAFPLENVGRVYPTGIIGSDGKAVSECGSISSAGVKLSFPLSATNNTSFNAIAIVEGPYRASMEICISSGFSSPSCPYFSLGTFR